MSKTVFLNNSAVFTCEANGSYTGWRIRGIMLIGTVYDDTTVSSFNSTVHKMVILARDEYNEVRIQCLTWHFGGSLLESETAILNIQGKMQFSACDINITIIILEF